MNYSLSEIARIAESENATILCSFLTHLEDSNALYVTLKVNVMDLSRLAAAFERFEYPVTGKFTEEDYEDTLKSRYESLLKYLEI